MPIRIAGHSVGYGQRMFVIAELGLNHGGSPDAAVSLAHAAAAAGASAVKLQTLHADALVAAHCPPPAHVEASSLRDFFRQFELNEPAHHAVAAAARANGLAVMSTPFDEAAVEMLERVGVDAYKIASGDLTHRRLIECAASTRKPVVLSTGMGELQEVMRALEWAERAGAAALAVLHCVSAYPVPEGSENLGAIATLARATGLPVGLSDHGQNQEAIVAATALGGSLYERHLVAHGDSDAIDRAVSSTPEELAASVASAERTLRALGHGRKTCIPAEAVNRHASRRGLYLAAALPRGTSLLASHLAALRPADGIPANHVHDLVGRVLARDLDAGAPLTWDDIAGAPEMEARHAV